MSSSVAIAAATGDPNSKNRFSKKTNLLIFGAIFLVLIIGIILLVIR